MFSNDIKLVSFLLAALTVLRSGSGKDFKILSENVSVLPNYLAFEKGRVLLLNKLEFSLPNNALCKV